MDLGLDGARVVVTGGSRGIGLGIAHALAREGAGVGLIARDPAAWPKRRAPCAPIGKRSPLLLRT